MDRRDQNFILFRADASQKTGHRTKCWSASQEYYSRKKDV